MQIVAYLGKGSQDARRLEETIRSAARTRRIAPCRTLGVLREELRLSQSLDTVLVLLAKSRRVLSSLLALQEYFDHLQLIVVVPDAEEKTLAKAHRLKPRYLALTGSDFADVGVVLARLLKRGEASLYRLRSASKQKNSKQGE